MLPDIKAIFSALTSPSDSGRLMADSPVLASLSALADVHRRMALRPTREIATAEAGDVDDSTLALWEAEQASIRDVDAAVAAALGHVSGAGVGSMLSRVCYWHARAFRDGIVLDGPQAAARQELARALAAYIHRASELGGLGPRPPARASAAAERVARTWWPLAPQTRARRSCELPAR